MIKVGLTGGIASGKSTIAKIFESLGVPVFYSDVVGKQLLNEDDLIRKKVVELFGQEVYDYSGLKREVLAKKVFNNPELLQQLNTIVHPAVRSAFLQFSNNNQHKSYILKEAAILFESGAHKELDKIICVSASSDERIERAMQRDGSKKEDVLDRMKHQLSEDERIALSDFVIDNNGSTLVIPQVLSIHKKLMNENS